MLETFNITHHDERRMSERNVALDELDVVLHYGRVQYRAGAKFYFLGKRDLPKQLRGTYARLVGTTVVTIEGVIATIYRNTRAIASIKRKPKRHIPVSPFKKHRD